MNVAGRSCLLNLPVDIVRRFTAYLDGYDLYQLFIAGDGQFNQVLKTKGVVEFRLCQDTAQSSIFPFVLPKFVSYFSKLQVLDIGRPNELMHLPIEHIDFSSLPRSLKHLSLAHLQPFNGFAIHHQYHVDFDVAYYFPELISLTLISFARKLHDDDPPHWILHVSSKSLPPSLTELNLLNMLVSYTPKTEDFPNSVDQQTAVVSRDCDAISETFGNVAFWPRQTFFQLDQRDFKPVFTPMASKFVLPAHLKSLKCNLNNDVVLQTVEWPNTLEYLWLDWSPSVHHPTEDWKYFPQTLKELYLHTKITPFWECISYLPRGLEHLTIILPLDDEIFCLERIAAELPPNLLALHIVGFYIPPSEFHALPRTLTSFSQMEAEDNDNFGNELVEHLSKLPQGLKALDIAHISPALDASDITRLPLEHLEGCSPPHQDGQLVLPSNLTTLYLNTIDLSLGSSCDLSLDSSLPMTLTSIVWNGTVTHFDSAFLPPNLICFYIMCDVKTTFLIKQWPSKLKDLSISMADCPASTDLDGIYRTLPRCLTSCSFHTSSLKWPVGETLLDLPRGLTAFDIPNPLVQADMRYLPAGLGCLSEITPDAIFCLPKGISLTGIFNQTTTEDGNEAKSNLDPAVFVKPEFNEEYTAENWKQQPPFKYMDIGVLADFEIFLKPPTTEE